jgi:hypothetical protein
MTCAAKLVGGGPWFQSAGNAALSALRASQARVAKISQSLSAQVRVQAGRPGVEVAG